MPFLKVRGENNKNNKRKKQRRSRLVIFTILSYLVSNIFFLLFQKEQLFVFLGWLKRNLGFVITLIIILYWLHRIKYINLKQIVDSSLAFILFLISLPLFLIISILIKIDSPGKIFFLQERLGKNRKIFKIIKFRTMREGAEKETGPVWAEEEDPRITLIGRFLRKSHLDELPQLINVLKGDMSLIGPRPERPELAKVIEKDIPQFSYRLGVKPGITGLAQVRYQYGASLEDARRKLKYDILYIKRVCFLLDLRILVWTIEKILTGEGAR